MDLGTNAARLAMKINGSRMMCIVPPATASSLVALVANAPERQAPFKNCRAADIPARRSAARPLRNFLLPGPGRHAGMQGEAGQLAYRVDELISQVHGPAASAR